MNNVRRAGDVNYIPAWQIRGAYSPPDSLRDLEYEKALSEERGTAGLTTSSTVSIPKPDEKDKEENMSELTREERRAQWVAYIFDDGPVPDDCDSVFSIRDDQTAEWALKKIREAEAEIVKWKAFYDERYQKVCDKCNLTIANMTALLHGYFDTVPHKVTKTQESYQLPSGKIMVKRKDPDFDVKGTEFMNWLKTNAPEYVKTVEAPNWAGFKKTLAKDSEGNYETVETENGLRAVTADGEVVPIAVTLNAPEFTYQLNKQKEGPDEIQD